MVVTLMVVASADGDGVPCVLASIRSRYPRRRHIFADGAAVVWEDLKTWKSPVSGNVFPVGRG